MPSKAPRSSKVKQAVFARFLELAKTGIHIDDVQLQDIEPLFASMNLPCNANKLYIYRFMFKNPGKFEALRATAEQVRKQIGGK